MEIFTDGNLIIWDKSELERAEKEVSAEEVISLRVGAKCYSEVGLSNLYKRIAKYKNITKVSVADDRILDPDMPSVKAKFEKLFPNASFEWSYDLLAGGKHGR
ncbi:hypothetical protein UA32_02460 [Photobacterium angustum]|uniref:hypothetical protein n=1 Tax=Photobacterium angustum TaxID=661 RepID=UPI0005DC28F0|nr:hypothetical protein [Photobacterium angustum]KJG01501.1 hypothetical protein UB35_12965 [Photobacterium angustum]KJG40645.1 hypothetical protein UA32_02460 [Photobacterium angustum]PSV65308.1 hypothetical protein CTM95_16765 [Photobacterium angustum]